MFQWTYKSSLRRQSADRKFNILHRRCIHSDLGSSSSGKFFTGPQVNQFTIMSVDPPSEEYITTVWNKPYIINRADFNCYESFRYALNWCRVAAREAYAEICFEVEEDDQEGLTELDKALRRGSCCTGVSFRKRTYNHVDWHEAMLSDTGKGKLAKFTPGVQVSLSRTDPFEKGRSNAFLKIHTRMKEDILWFDNKNTFPEDIEKDEWRLDLVPNEQALQNVLDSIQIVAQAESTSLHRLIVQNPVTLDLSTEEMEKLKYITSLDHDSEQRLHKNARDNGLNKCQTKAFVEAHRERCLLIQGPPGTGKTITAATILSKFAAKDEKLLLTSGSNAAVDDVTSEECGTLNKSGVEWLARVTSR